jgi:hypothetical protein
MTLFGNVWSLDAKRYFARAEWPSHEMPKVRLKIGYRRPACVPGEARKCAILNGPATTECNHETKENRSDKPGATLGKAIA